MMVKVLIPAFNEEKSIQKVIDDIPKDNIDEIIVVDNGSNDNTALYALQAGATVLHQPTKGYGRACLTGIDYLKNKDKAPDILAFIDGDYADYPEQMVTVLEPILQNRADFVIGSRALGKSDRFSMTAPQRFGNWLSTALIKKMYGIHYTDLGPFRAIKFSSLLQLNMKDKNFGWTVEMQLKAAQLSLRIEEVPVDYRKRIGKSKVSGTLKGSVLAGYKILKTIFKYYK